MQVKKQGIWLICALSVQPLATTATKACCPSDGKGVQMIQNIAAASAQPRACCPTEGNGIANTGLGLAQPETLDLSVSHAWHAYTFIRDNIRYVQISDSDNKVHAAIATANGSVLTLPMGEDEVRRVGFLPAGTPVYNDGMVIIMPQVTPSGSVIWLVKSNS